MYLASVVLAYYVPPSSDEVKGAYLQTKQEKKTTEKSAASISK
jgi:hypothetical protein